MLMVKVEVLYLENGIVNIGTVAAEMYLESL